MMTSLKDRLANFAEKMTDEDHIHTTRTVVVGVFAGIIATLGGVWAINQIEHPEHH